MKRYRLGLRMAVEHDSKFTMRRNAACWAESLLSFLEFRCDHGVRQESVSPLPRPSRLSMQVRVAVLCCDYNTILSKATNA